jgi:hypothetical protein
LLKTNVGEREVLVFVQPYRPVFREEGNDGSGTNWYIAGIVAVDRLSAKVMAVPLTALAAVILALVLGILAWPYLKIPAAAHHY